MYLYTVYILSVVFTKTKYAEIFCHYDKTLSHAYLFSVLETIVIVLFSTTISLCLDSFSIKLQS